MRRRSKRSRSNGGAPRTSPANPVCESGDPSVDHRSTADVAAIADAPACPVHGNQTILPVGTKLNEGSLSQPREVFKSEAIGGAKSYLPNLGDLAFRALSVGKPDGLIDGHPQSSKVDLFEAYVQNVLDALEAKPRLKAETAVFITWDEAGGYWIPASSADRKRAQLFGATITCCRHGSFIAASTYSAVCRKRRSFGAV